MKANITYLDTSHLSDKFQLKLNSYRERKNINYYIKRIIDIIVSLSLILVLSPILFIVALLIKIDSKGPIFYISHRIGCGLKVFRFYKFRTMKTGSDKLINQCENQYNDSTFFKVKNDPRVTKLGKFLRNNSLDELPQLFNVLKGDMNIVGNRPLPIYEAKNIINDEWASERFIAPAGITGLWQVTKRGKESVTTKERLGLDVEYAKNNSLKTDLQIILKTPIALFQKSSV